MGLFRALLRGEPTAIIVTAGGLVLALSFGVRSVFGGVVEPLSQDLFAGRLEIFSLSIAIQNLVWGLAQPAFGLLADKYGDRRALWLGFIFYVLGMLITVTSTSAWGIHIGAGFFVGLGISGTAFGTVMAIVGRAAPEEKRTAYLGVASAIGSGGQVVFPLLVGWLVTWLDWQATLLVMASSLIGMVFLIPLLKAKPAQPIKKQSFKVANPAQRGLLADIQAAFSYKSYFMLWLGFFVCGFHLAFVTAHFPNFVQHFCLSDASAEALRGLGLQALAVAGFANIIGTLWASHLGGSYSKPYILAAIYGLRALLILVFISLPITPVSVILFALFMGVLWLSTVPLTSALVLIMFGPRLVGTLFGFVFLSHQLGSFVGVWLGGYLFDIYGNYDLMWYLGIALGVLSALAHLGVQETKAPARLAVA